MTDGNGPTDPGYQPRAIVESFLQNVVVLDDFVVISQQGDDRPGEIPDTTIISPDYRIPQATSDSGVSPGRRDVELHADTVINAFADLGMVCAVLKADPGSASPDRTVRAAVRADIVILDWKIHEQPPGDVALSVMKRILADDQSSHRLRLIAIYTGEPDLGSISKRVQGTIQDYYEDEELDAEDPSRITKGPVRIVIFAKEGTLSDRSPYRGYHEVGEGELAEKLADEFESMTSGLLRNVALAGIATIRENAHRVLARFDRHLDPGYLGHRLLLLNPRDAEDHLVAALGSELLSILEEDRPGAHADIRAIERWLTEGDVPDLSEPFRFPGKTRAVDCWLQLLQRGIESNDAELPQGGKAGLISKGTTAFTDNAATATLSDYRFAALLSLKTLYPAHRRRLTLGTILCRENDGRCQYLLCLQPKCDSIRLGEEAGFPLIPLEILHGRKKDSRFRLVVEIADGQWQDLGVTPKPADLIVPSFVPCANPPREVLAVEEVSGQYYFKDLRGNRYRWIAEIKDEHAFRVAGELASALSRPGPDDAEWIRRASKS